MLTSVPPPRRNIASPIFLSYYSPNTNSVQTGTNGLVINSNAYYIYSLPGRLFRICLPDKLLHTLYKKLVINKYNTLSMLIGKAPKYALISHVHG